MARLNPLVITLERLQEVLDDAVQRGRMTRDDAAELFAALVRRGRAGVAGTVRRGPGLPIGGYEDLTAAEIVAQLDGLSPEQLRQIHDHERRNANRKTVLSAIERKLP